MSIACKNVELRRERLEHEGPRTDRTRVREGDRVAHAGPEMLGKDIRLPTQVPQDRHPWPLQFHNDRVIIGGRHICDYIPEATVIKSRMIVNQAQCEDNVSARERFAIRPLNAWPQLEGETGGIA